MSGNKVKRFNELFYKHEETRGLWYVSSHCVDDNGNGAMPIHFQRNCVESLNY